MTITERYAQYCTSLRYEDIPDDVIDYTKQLILDTLGIAVGSGIRAESSESFLDAVETLDANGEGATVLTTGRDQSPEYAAFVNGAMAHSLDYDDTHRGASLHPGAPVIPAALAAAETEGASGRELVTAIVAGYELTCRLGMAVNPASHYDRGFHMTATCGTFGATAAVGVVRGYDTETFEAAFGLNGSQAAGSLQFLENGSWNKRAHPGLAGKRGIVSATVAESGFFGASAPIEGERGFLYGYSDDPQPEKATAGLGEEYELLNTAIKPYPCCRYMHAPMDLLSDIAATEDVDPSDVESVTVSIATPGIKLVGAPTHTYPQSFVDAQFSMPFGAALILGCRDGGVDAFLDAIDGGIPADVTHLIDCTTVTDSEWIDEAYPEQWAADVEVRTRSETFSRETEYARGEPENPLSWDELVAKYEELTEPVLGAAATSVRERIADLESIAVTDLIEPFTERKRTVPATDN